MRSTIPFLPLLALATTLPFAAPPLRAGDDGARLAQEVFKASGGENWSAVQTVRFTFQVEQPGKPEPLLTAKHVWEVAANRDTVTWNGKTVTVDLGAPNAEGDAKAAFARWTNDAYWLVAPLKLLDHGVLLGYGGKQNVEGKECEVLNVSFEKVGLTNNDRYTYYVDPQTHLPLRWDYLPAPEKKVSGSWESYRDAGGLKLATEHAFGDKRLRILDLEVSR